MNTIQRQKLYIELIKDQAHWGKMNVVQMITHCATCEEYYFGKIKVKRSFKGRFFGQKAIRKILKDEFSSFGKNAPTKNQFIVSNTDLDFETEKANWRQLIERHEAFNAKKFTHWSFGEMTKEQLGQFIYKHCNHHLKQFGA